MDLIIKKEEPEEQVLDNKIVEEVTSLHALSGTEIPNTITLRGEYKKNDLTILLDSGSTHRFLDMKTSRHLGCTIKEAMPMRVTMANGNKLISRHTCPKFNWKIQGVEFTDTVRLVKLGACEMILGGDWMRNLNPVLLDFVAYGDQITHQGKRVELKEIYHEGVLKSMSGSSVKQLFKKGRMRWDHLLTITTDIEKEYIIPESIAQTLEEYANVFVEPTTLPISLKLGSILVSIRPYRYNFFQKNEIEK